MGCASGATFFRPRGRIISSHIFVLFVFGFGRKHVFDVDYWGFCSGSGVVKPRPDLSRLPDSRQITFHSLFPIVWDGSLRDVTRRIWKIRETIAANVETLAHPAIGWAAFLFFPKWDVFG